MTPETYGWRLREVYLSRVAGVSGANTAGEIPNSVKDLDLKDPKKRLVEAAGVEPASENVVSKEPTYLVTFMRRSYPALSPAALRADKKRSRPT